MAGPFRLLDDRGIVAKALSAKKNASISHMYFRSQSIHLFFISQRSHSPTAFYFTFVSAFVSTHNLSSKKKKKKTTKPPFPHECVQFTWMCPPHTCHFSLRWQFLIYKSFPLFNRILTQRTKATKVKGTHRFNAERSTREPERGRREAVAGNYRTLFFSAEASGVSRKIFLFFQKNEKHKRERSRVAKNNGERDIESQS